jgi:DNA-binding transcriptional LysR family regulator
MLFDTAARYFLEVARTGSIAAAAEQLHVASSAISRQITKLEEAVGCALFERRARGMVLSSAGARLAAYVRNSALEGERVLEELRDGAHQADRIVRIACTDGFASGMLAETMAGFRRLHPQCTFSVHVTSPESVSGMVARGDVDIGMKFSVAPERGLRVEHQQPAPIMLVVAAGHALAGRRALQLRELGDLPLALPLHGTTLRHLLELKFQSEGLRLQGAFSGSLATLLPLVVQGDAVLFASVFSVSVQLSSGQLVAIALPELDFHPRQVQLLTHDDHLASPLKQAFCRHLVKAVIDHG